MSVLEPAELEAMRVRLLKLQCLPGAPGWTGTTLRGALAVLLLVFFSTLPVVDSVRHHARRACRPCAFPTRSPLVLLFVAGYAFGRLTGRHPVVVGTAMVVLGSLLVGLTIALGG